MKFKKIAPAHISGIKKNDKIVSIDNKKVNSILEVSTFISTSTFGKHRIYNS
jgi:S1-C subfamily serine protease